jgi:hypothetical protein
MILEQSQSVLTVDEVVRELARQFDAINAEGEMCYDVPTKQLHEDTDRFLKNLVSKKLLQTELDAQGRECYRINEGVSGTTSPTLANVATDKSAFRSEPVDSSNLPDIKPSKRETFGAFLGLLIFDLTLRFRGFSALIARVESWPTAEPRVHDNETCQRVRATVDRAQMYYPKKAMCLQHSAVVTCLLRRRGVPAEMVLAAQEFPPKAHAWVEVLNEVVNDSAEIKGKYHEFRRL